MCDKIALNYTHVHTHTPSHTHTHTSASITNEIWISSVDGTNVNFLVVTLYCIYGICYHLGKLGEGCMGPPCTFLYKFLWILSILKQKVNKNHINKKIRGCPIVKAHFGSTQFTKVKQISFLQGCSEPLSSSWALPTTRVGDVRSKQFPKLFKQQNSLLKGHLVGSEFWGGRLRKHWCIC